LEVAEYDKTWVLNGEREEICPISSLFSLSFSASLELLTEKAKFDDPDGIKIRPPIKT